MFLLVILNSSKKSGQYWLISVQKVYQQNVSQFLDRGNMESCPLPKNQNSKCTHGETARYITDTNCPACISVPLSHSFRFSSLEHNCSRIYCTFDTNTMSATTCRAGFILASRSCTLWDALRYGLSSTSLKTWLHTDFYSCDCSAWSLSILSRTFRFISCCCGTNLEQIEDSLTEDVRKQMCLYDSSSQH